MHVLEGPQSADAGKRGPLDETGQQFGASASVLCAAERCHSSAQCAAPERGDSPAERAAAQRGDSSAERATTVPDALNSPVCDHHRGPVAACPRAGTIGFWTVTAASRPEVTRLPGSFEFNPMSQKHVNLLREIFQDPVNTNIHWREIESLLKHLGAQLESLAGARIRVKLNNAEGILHRPHHGGNTLDRHSVQSLREFLSRGGATPSQYEARKER